MQLCLPFPLSAASLKFLNKKIQIISEHLTNLSHCQCTEYVPNTLIGSWHKLILKVIRHAHITLLTLKFDEMMWGYCFPTWYFGKTMILLIVMKSKCSDIKYLSIEQSIWNHQRKGCVCNLANKQIGSPWYILRLLAFWSKADSIFNFLHSAQLSPHTLTPI